MAGITVSSQSYAGAWKNTYINEADIDFTATDFASFKSAFINYIKITSPENFNDYTDNSELIILINLLAYLGENLSYKNDLNTRDNFITTTERKTSLLNFAKMVNYNVSRNICSSGILKLTQVMTNEDVRDSLNNSLKNIPVSWNDISNNSWFEHFITILNSAFTYNNPYGRPTKTGTINGVKVTKYEFNTAVEQNLVSYPFSANINSQNMSFEIINEDFEDNGKIYEQTPNPNAPFHIIYQNDGAGNSSNNTGFFLKFKQGQLQFQDFNFDTAIESRTITIDMENINNDDVWVEQIDEEGSVISEWVKVDTIYNTIYNDEAPTVRNIYQVVTENDDKITIKFSDGRFGAIPKGIFRVWYRTSINQTYTIKPQDMKNLSITIPYKKNTNTTDDIYNLTLTFSLLEDVSNAVVSEEIESIRERAPAINKTQNRMVSGEDYNEYPKKLGNIVKKFSTINRTYPGHSRYIDINDPTGMSQNTDIFGDDGIIYGEDFTKVNEENLPSPYTTDVIVSSKLLPLLNSSELTNFLYNHYKPFSWVISHKSPEWVTYSDASRSSIGYFIVNGVIAPFGVEATDNGKYILQGSLIKFTNENNFDKWVKVTNIGYRTIDNINTQTVIISEELDPNYTWEIKEIFPPFNLSLTDDNLNEIISEMDNKALNGNAVQSSKDFGLCYNYENQSWEIIDGNKLKVKDNNGEIAEFDYDTLDDGHDISAWLIHVEWSTTKWTFTCRYTQYVFESINTVRFSQINYDSTANTSDEWGGDYINFLKINTNPSGGTYNEDIKFAIYDNITYKDGYIEPRRVKISLTDSDSDGIPDNPDLFIDLVPTISEETPENNNFIFYHLETDSNGYQYYQYTSDIVVVSTSDDVTKINTVYYIIDSKEFAYYDPNRDDSNKVVTYPKGVYKSQHGRSNLIFQWKHFADKNCRIDPSPSSIMDMYILTTQYANEVLDWKNTLNKTTDIPDPPTPGELKTTMESIIPYKSATDSIVFHSTKFKILFGNEADEKLRAVFKVNKTTNSIISDNEIKQKTIQYIDEFFDLDNWNFGDTFNFQQLANYIMTKFNGAISSCVIVPSYPGYKFGELFQIRFESDELPLSTANISNVQIIDVITQNNIKIGY